MQTTKIERKVGAKGFYGEFPATVRRICDWSDSLVEVCVPGGEICVSIEEITAKPR